MLRNCSCAAVVVALCTHAQQANAVLLEIFGSGVVSYNNGYDEAMLGSTFDYSIVIDLDALDSGGGGTAIAQFDAVQSFTVDSFDHPTISPSHTPYNITYVRQLPLRDILYMKIGQARDHYTSIFGILPPNYFGTAPYSLHLLEGLDVSDFTSARYMTMVDTADDGSARGDITTISTRIVPEPATAVLFFVCASVAMRRSRRHCSCRR